MGDYGSLCRCRIDLCGTRGIAIHKYYDLAEAPQFEQIFGHLAIGKNPTLLHNRYFVLTWDFSTVYASGNAAELRQALSDHNKLMARLNKMYVERLRELLLPDVDDREDGQDAVRTFLRGGDIQSQSLMFHPHPIN